MKTEIGGTTAALLLVIGWMNLAVLSALLIVQFGEFFDPKPPRPFRADGWPRPPRTDPGEGMEAEEEPTWKKAA